MKTFKYIICILLSSVVFVNCADDFDAIPEGSLILPEDTEEWETTMTIGELINVPICAGRVPIAPHPSIKQIPPDNRQ